MGENEAPEFGLLVTVAQPATGADAESLRRRLTANGIRSTVAPGTNGRTRILVFRENAAHARRLVGGGALDPSAE
ncbi:hypothetical protein [Asanoa iriomotensis]|uniref:SPOR domain-containing protein n=1 Tax=Asanoa iriomotensis TaxID=234613 RepID=A0ABQ4BWU8_9ACTN|nr:hypothetical protein [Asanoa iriomotensis]GIF54960.1 hypothetical protein Air01nite_10550 [Asanoa iriomotensis]